MRSRLLLGSGIALAALWTACGGAGGTDDGLTGSDNGPAVGTGGTSHGGKSSAGGSSGKGGSSGTSPGLIGGSGGSVGGSSPTGAGGTIGGAGGSTGGTSAGGTSAGGGVGAGGAGGALMCAMGTADCNGKPDDKCETHIDVDISNCGKCGNVCPVPPNGSAACTAGVCSTACVAGFMDCDGNTANGCETKTSSDPSHCGSCTNVCPDGGGATAMCSASTCGLQCAMGTGDCNHVASDGCEASLGTDPTNCGSCGMDCMGGTCVNGACSCAGETSKAQKLPLDMFIMMDQSGSMSDTVASGATKWQAVTQALNAFVMDPNSNGLGVGIQYFGLPPGGGGPPTTCTKKADCIVNGVDYSPCFFGMCLGAVASTDSCDPNDYAKPEVEIAPLPGVGPMITQSLAKHGPSTSTPTAPALQGALMHAKDWATAHKDHVVIAVLATDGDPSECTPMDIPGIAQIAMNGATMDPRVRTFVIGVGTSTASLNAIAMGGGTDSAFIVDTTMDVVKQFQDALTKIQGTALGCQYTLPMPAMGTLDPTKVNVVYTPGDMSMPAQTLGKVADSASCGPMGGWYYDNDANPTQILLCPATCGIVSMDSMGSIDIQLGCATKKE